jgi:hypothetical protein
LKGLGHFNGSFQGLLALVGAISGVKNMLEHGSLLN